MAAVGVAAIFGACVDATPPPEVRVVPALARSALAGECRFAVDCPGRKCVRLAKNLQGRRSLCAKSCTSDADCGEAGICFDLGRAGPTCLAKCGPSVINGSWSTGRPACPPGLACVTVGLGGERACFVEPSFRATAGRDPG